MQCFVPPSRNRAARFAAEKKKNNKKTNKQRLCSESKELEEASSHTALFDFTSGNTLPALRRNSFPGCLWATPDWIHTHKKKELLNASIVSIAFYWVCSALVFRKFSFFFPSLGTFISDFNPGSVFQQWQTRTMANSSSKAATQVLLIRRYQRSQAKGSTLSLT